MSAHTPGPWRAEGNRVFDANGGEVAVATRADPRNRICAATTAARLAALPLAEAALSDLLEYEGGADSALHDPYVVERAVAALAALRGETLALAEVPA